MGSWRSWLARSLDMREVTGSSPVEPTNMPFVYILKGRNSRFYIGSTNNLERKIREHQLGKSKYTSENLPVELVFKQEYNNLSNARKIEYKLKRLKRRDIIEKIIKEGKIKLGA